MDNLSSFIPLDRRQALLRNAELPQRAVGAALFADISGFTPLTEALLKNFGAKHGAEKLTEHLNTVYGKLIAELHRYGGSVIGFSGDAITCWLNNDDGRRAVACGLAMQKAMQQFAMLQISANRSVALNIKIAVSAGQSRRFYVGNPAIQRIDVLAGQTIDRMAAAEKAAEKGEVIVAPEVAGCLGNMLEIREWRRNNAGKAFAVVGKLQRPVETISVGIPSAPERTVLLPDDIARPWLLPPIYERLKYRQDQFLAEIRPAVTLFLRFEGIDYDQDNAAGDKLDSYIRWVQQILDGYGGYLLQLTHGDKGSYLYAVFGAPIAHDDDAARATTAALDLVSLPEELKFVVNIQIGISQGRMRVGPYGSSARRTYGVLGDEVNVAARLMSKAAPGQILVSHRVFKTARTRFDFKELGEISVKGREDTRFLIYEAVRRKAAPLLQSYPTGIKTALVGRERELQALRETLLAKGQFIRLQGAAGIGKSRLIAELLQQANKLGFRTALGACQSTTQAIAYYPWRQIFRDLLELPAAPAAEEGQKTWMARRKQQLETVIRNANPAWLLRLPLLGDLLDIPLPDNNVTKTFSGSHRQKALFSLAAEIIADRAAKTPLLLIVEDAHWIDETSQAFTAYLGRVIALLPVVLLVSRRPLEEGRQSLFPELEQLPNCKSVDLSELPPQNVEALLAANLKEEGDISPLLLSLMQQLTHGNPLFIEELLKSLQEEEAKDIAFINGIWDLSPSLFNALQNANCLSKDNGEWILAPNAPLSALDLHLPDSLHSVVSSRVDRLPDPEKLTMKVASVIGHTFEFDLLVAAHPNPGEALTWQMETLQARGFIQVKAPYSSRAFHFNHHLTQEVVYQTLLEKQQKDIHLSVGSALEELHPEAVEQLADHYRRSGLRRDKTLFYLGKAARKSQTEYANQTALNYYRQALELEERWEWRKGQAETLHILGRPDEELAALEHLENNPQTPRFEIGYLKGKYYEAMSEYDLARTALEEALLQSRAAENGEVEMNCLAYLGRISLRQGSFEQAQRQYKESIARLEKSGTLTPAQNNTLLQMLNSLGTTFRFSDKTEKAEKMYNRALTLSWQINNRYEEARTLNNLGVLALKQRQFQMAERFHQQALQLRQKIDDYGGEGESLCNLAILDRDRGRYAQAEKYFYNALEIYKLTGNRWEEANIRNDLGILYQELGDYARAKTSLEKGKQLNREFGDNSGIIYCNFNLGLVMRDSGHLDKAEMIFNETLAMVVKNPESNEKIAVCYSYLATVKLAANEPETAIDFAKRALAIRQRLGLNAFIADDLAVLARAFLDIQAFDEAVKAAEQSLSILDERGGEGPEDPARDYYFVHQVFWRIGKKDTALSALKSAFCLVMNRAGNIVDLNQRHNFLNRVKTNREIIDAAKKHGLEFKPVI